MGFFGSLLRSFKKPAVQAAATAIGTYYGAPYAGKALGMVSDLVKSDAPTSAAQAAGPPDPSAYGSSVEQPQTVTVTGQGPPSSAGVDWSKAIGAVAPIASGLLTYAGQNATNAANAAAAQKQMDFQAQQTGTAYQRATADMQAAGLNPMLAYSQGGASSGSGASSVSGNALGAGATSAMSTWSQVGQLQNLFAQNDQIRAQTSNTDSQTALNELIGLKTIQDTKTSAASARQLDQAVTNAIATLDGINLDNQYNRGSMASRLDSARFAAQLGRYQLAPAKAESDFAETPFGATATPALKSLGSLGGILGGMSNSAAGLARLFGRRP